MNVHDSLNAHFKTLECVFPFTSFSNDTLITWAAPLVESFDENACLPYNIGGRQRYRASPLASAIIWLSREGMLPEDLLGKMQDSLLFLRDNAKKDDPSPGCDKKNPEDTEGWSFSEGVSVWSTSMSILALTDNLNLGLSKASAFKKSVVWLATQRDEEKKGWGYQKSDNCTVNPIMTALAVRALAATYTGVARAHFDFSDEEDKTIKKAIVKGVEYLRETCQTSKEHVFWKFNNTPNCAATTWALLAIKESAAVVPSGADDFIKMNTDKALQFILSKMPSVCEMWAEEKIVEESGAKYDAQKNYYSYSVTLLPELFSLGLSPYHAKVIYQMQWIVQNRNAWKSMYNKTEVCSFTFAMVLSTLVCWIRMVGVSSAPGFLTHDETKTDRLIEKLTGSTVIKKSSFLYVEKKKILLEIGIILLLFVVAFTYRQVFAFAQSCMKSIFDISSKYMENVIPGIISTFIYGLFASLFRLLLKLLKKRIR